MITEAKADSSEDLHVCPGFLLTVPCLCHKVIERRRQQGCLGPRRQRSESRALGTAAIWSRAPEGRKLYGNGSPGFHMWSPHESSAERWAASGLNEPVGLQRTSECSDV